MLLPSIVTLLAIIGVTISSLAVQVAKVLIGIGTHHIIPSSDHGGAAIALPDHLHGDVAKEVRVLERLLDDVEADVVALNGNRVPPDGLPLLKVAGRKTGMGGQDNLVAGSRLHVVVDVVGDGISIVRIGDELVAEGHSDGDFSGVAELVGGLHDLLQQLVEVAVLEVLVGVLHNDSLIVLVLVLQLHLATCSCQLVVVLDVREGVRALAASPHLGELSCIDEVGGGPLRDTDPTIGLARSVQPPWLDEPVHYPLTALWGELNQLLYVV